MISLLAAPDKFSGTASALEVASACVDAARALGWSALAIPMSDGGEGFLEAVGGVPRTSIVTGPLSIRVEATWMTLERSRCGIPTAVIESARASGLLLTNGPVGNDPVGSTTTGTGELILAAVASGARRIIVGCGGSATTDGGVGAVDVIGSCENLRGAELIVACDVSTRFLDAARIFGPQKGANDKDVIALSKRLVRISKRYRRQFGIDVTTTAGAGAAGGLAGGLVAVGGRIASGVDVVAELVHLDEAIERAHIVVTGEGRLDRTSFLGKVVGKIVDRVGGRKPVLCISGQIDDDLPALGYRVDKISLVERFGKTQAMLHPGALCAQALTDYIVSGALS